MDKTTINRNTWHHRFVMWARRQWGLETEPRTTCGYIRWIFGAVITSLIIFLFQLVVFTWKALVGVIRVLRLNRLFVSLTRLISRPIGKVVGKKLGQLEDWWDFTAQPYVEDHPKKVGWWTIAIFMIFPLVFAPFDLEATIALYTCYAVAVGTLMVMVVTLVLMVDFKDEEPKLRFEKQADSAVVGIGKIGHLAAKNPVTKQSRRAFHSFRLLLEFVHHKTCRIITYR